MIENEAAIFDLMAELQEVQSDLGTAELVALLNRGQRELIDRVTWRNPTLFNSFQTSQTVASISNNVTATIPYGTWPEVGGGRIIFADTSSPANTKEVKVIPTWSEPAIDDSEYVIFDGNKTMTFKMPSGSRYTTAVIYRLQPYINIIYDNTLLVNVNFTSLEAICLKPSVGWWGENELKGARIRYANTRNLATDLLIDENSDGSPPGFKLLEIPSGIIRWPLNSWAETTRSAVKYYPTILYRFLLPSAYHRQLINWCKFQLNPQRYPEPELYGKGFTMSRARSMFS